MKTYIGIDNGTTGTIGIITDDQYVMLRVPTKSELSYTKKKQNITRVDGVALTEILNGYISHGYPLFALLERPMVNPAMFKASMSAMRALEAVLVILENVGVPFQYIDSKEWQKVLLPHGVKGSTDLKKASLDIGKRLFPAIDIKTKDYDGLLIAEYARRKGF